MNCSRPYGTSPQGSTCSTRWPPPGCWSGCGRRERRQGDERLAHLTDQERRILDLIGEGSTNRAIGERLHLAEKTIKNYVSELLSKMGMQRRSQAAAYVARMQAERHERQGGQGPRQGF